jgi:Fe-S cluster biogenesis protein NfuA
MRRQVLRILNDKINPSVASHGGKIELIDVVNDIVYIKMSGGCQGCAASSVTLKQGVERTLKDELPDIMDVVDVTDHHSGKNPFYRP